MKHISTALCTVAIMLASIVHAETCELCQKAFETGQDITAGMCKCSQPCDCFDKSCPCLWYGCCAELTTNEDLVKEQQGQPEQQQINDLVVKKPIHEVTVKRPVKKEIVEKPVVKKEPREHKHKGCSYCKGDAKAKKCVCSSHCNCIKTNCKCIKEGCQCGTKAISKETEPIVLKTNIPYTLVLKTDATEKTWVVGNRKLPKWLTVVKQEQSEKGSSQYTLTAAKKGKTTLLMHYIGKDEKKPVRVMRYKITVEKGIATPTPSTIPATKKSEPELIKQTTTAAQ
jgi:hypothetical protein